MNNFTISISYNYNIEPGCDVIGHDMVKGESLIEALSKFLIVIASIQKNIGESEVNLSDKDDDIPF